MLDPLLLHGARLHGSTGLSAGSCYPAAAHMASMGNQTTTLPCAICLVKPQLVRGNPDAPYGANVFTSSGHYGATAYDPVFGGEHLRLLICTGCLLKMQENGSVHRVLHATDETPEQLLLWGSDEDPGTDNPWNEQRLRNDLAMAEFAESTPGMTEEWSGRIYATCQEASRYGKTFNPAEVPQREGKQD